MSLSRTVKSAWVIARRDFTATVLSKTFLLFLLGPLFPLLVGAMFGGIGAQVASDADQPVVAVLAPPADFARIEAARSELAVAVRGASFVRLYRVDPAADRTSQTKKLLGSSQPPIAAVLADPLGTATLTGSFRNGSADAAQVQLLLTRARSDAVPAVLDVREVAVSAGTTATIRSVTARLGQGLLFLLTLLLAGMLLSQLIEEKSNKVIEVLAAAVPVDAIFMGKLFAMLAMSLVGIAVWATAAVAGIWLLAPPEVLARLPAPAVGWPIFGLLAVIYFAMSYLLIGAAFLGIGAQASTVRQVQTLSMPITMSQVLIFAFASAGVSDGNGPVGLASAIFPLSSPFAMLARAAESGAIWTHLLAIAWQILWVALILKFAARIFRRSVLKSGGGRRSWWRRSRAQTYDPQRSGSIGVAR